MRTAVTYAMTAALAQPMGPTGVDGAPVDPSAVAPRPARLFAACPEPRGGAREGDGHFGVGGINGRDLARGSMSENGPREGTRDLPKRDREAGFRAVDPRTPAGIAYAEIGRAARRRRDELLELVRQGLPAARIAALYQAAHPLELPVTAEEIRSLARRR